MSLSPSPSPSLLEWFLSWRILRRTLVCLAGFITLAAAFYTVENWRGRRAWEQCRRELEAKGEILDWEKFIPPPIPDGENFFKAPGMLAWFSRAARETNQNVRIYSVSEAMWLMSSAGGILEKVRALPENAPEGATDRFDLATDAIPGVSVQVLPVIGLTNMTGREVIEQLARLANVKVTFDKTLDSSVNLTRVTPFWRANLTARAALADYLKRRWLTARWDASSQSLEIVPMEKPVSPTSSHAGLRTAFAEYEPEYRLLAEACQRPKSRLADNYSAPFNVDIPSYVNARNVAQSLGVHASLSLLDGKPDVAVQDLAMMRRVGEVMNDGHLLVGMMIHVAIEGLYLQTARDGLSAGLWKEPQLAAIQRQTRDVDLLVEFAQSVRRGERAGAIRALDWPPRELAKLFGSRDLGVTGGRSGIDWQQFCTRIQLELCPRGWIQQNKVVLVRAAQELLDALDTVNRRVHVARLNAWGERLQKLTSSHGPYTFLGTKVTPNFVRAVQTLARNQTQLDQLHVACALERYRLVRGNYPEKLDALIPEFLERVPKDLFAEAPLKYRLDDRGYRLWSVGWDEKDEGGLSVLDKDGKPDYAEQSGDWTWRVPSKP